MRNHRFLNSHIVNPANDRLCITVLDEPGPGNANHLYMISGFDTSTNPAKLIADDMDGEPVDLAIKQSGALAIIFQNATLRDASAQRQAADVEPILKFFAFEHLPEHLQSISKNFSMLAHGIIHTLPRNAERSVALRKLLEAKDAAVRAAL